MSLRILIVDSYYEKFLDSIYYDNPFMVKLSYREQLNKIMSYSFGVANFYSSNLRKLGHEADEVIFNCLPLQQQWVYENSLRLRKPLYYIDKILQKVSISPKKRYDYSMNILLEQIKQYRPDVIHIQDINNIDNNILRDIKPFVKLLTCQIACPLNKNIDLSMYDLVLSSFPHFVERFRAMGLDSSYFRLGFSKDILLRMDKRQNINYDVVFIGGLSSMHSERIKLLEEVANNYQLDIWGYGVDSLSKGSNLRKRHHGELWGNDMYKVIKQSAIVLNKHINVAENCANNMRMYETTGVGAMLLTDRKENIRASFEPNKEVVEYEGIDDCCKQIEYYLKHNSKRDVIAQAGQQRTLKDHTWEIRMQEYEDLILNRL